MNERKEDMRFRRNDRINAGQPNPKHKAEMNTATEKKKTMNENEQNAPPDYVEVPSTKLTRTLKALQDMFPHMNTAIIDRAVITAKGDFDVALEKLLVISSKFS